MFLSKNRVFIIQFHATHSSQSNMGTKRKSTKHFDLHHCICFDFIQSEYPNMIYSKFLLLTVHE
jgi:hypothetical protein